MDPTGIRRPNDRRHRRTQPRFTDGGVNGTRRVDDRARGRLGGNCSHSEIAHLINLWGVVGPATAHLESGGLPRAFGVGGGALLVAESTTVAVAVVVGWVVVWTALGGVALVHHATRDGGSAAARQNQLSSPMSHVEADRKARCSPRQ